MLKLTRLKETRELAGLSQDELAETSGVARATVADLELGKRVAQPRTARRLAAALQVEIRELLEEPAPKATAPSRSGLSEALKAIGEPIKGGPPEEELYTRKELEDLSEGRTVITDADQTAPPTAEEELIHTQRAHIEALQAEIARLKPLQAENARLKERLAELERSRA